MLCKIVLIMRYITGTCDITTTPVIQYKTNDPTFQMKEGGTGTNLRYHDERCQAGTWAPAIYRNGTQGKSARAMCQYSLLKVLFPFSLNPELYRLS